jgi:RNA-binding motif X-linked protein 2
MYLQLFLIETSTKSITQTMNTVKAIQKLNADELAKGTVDTTSSWHNDYKDSAYIYVGGLDRSLSEGDVITVFEQYGRIVDLDFKRDEETGRPLGYCFLAYEDQRSTNLAVDNLNGITLVGNRVIRVDHHKGYFKKEKNENNESTTTTTTTSSNSSPSRKKQEYPVLSNTLKHNERSNSSSSRRNDRDTNDRRRDYSDEDRYSSRDRRDDRDRDQNKRSYSHYRNDSESYRRSTSPASSKRQRR